MAHAEISVNFDTLEANKVHGTNNPPITVTRGEEVTQAHSVEILDSANNMVAVISYIKGDRPEVCLIAPTGIRISTNPVQPIPAFPPRPETAEESGFHLSVSDFKE